MNTEFDTIVEDGSLSQVILSDILHNYDVNVIETWEIVTLRKPLSTKRKPFYTWLSLVQLSLYEQ